MKKSYNYTCKRNKCIWFKLYMQIVIPVWKSCSLYYFILLYFNWRFPQNSSTSVAERELHNQFWKVKIPGSLTLQVARSQWISFLPVHTFIHFHFPRICIRSIALARKFYLQWYLVLNLRSVLEPWTLNERDAQQSATLRTQAERFVLLCMCKRQTWK